MIVSVLCDINIIIITYPEQKSVIEDRIHGIPLDNPRSVFITVGGDSDQFNLNLRAPSVSVRANILARDHLKNGRI